MLDRGLLLYAVLEPHEVFYVLEVIEDEPGCVIVNVKLTSRERSFLYVPTHVLQTTDGQRYTLTIIAYERDGDILWFQARGYFIEEEMVLERGA